jgi:ATPase subunit of ABC transporter with duplicated ATPase domains
MKKMDKKKDKQNDEEQQDYGWFVQLRTKQQEERQQKEKAQRKKIWAQLEKQRQAEQAQQRKREQLEQLEKLEKQQQRKKKKLEKQRQVQQQQTEPLLHNTSLQTLDVVPRRYSPTSSILSTERFNDIVTTVMIILVGVGVKVFFNL